MRARIVLSLVAFAALVAIPGADARVVRGGTVEIGKGVAGIELGMTRAEVRAQLGRPVDQNPRFMAYGPRNSATTTFDVYLEGGKGTPVRMLGFWGPRFRLADSTRIFDRRGVVRKLKRRYGRRLVRKHVKRTDTRLFRLKGRHAGRRVWTDFYVDRFGERARILSAFILYPHWTP